MLALTGFHYDGVDQTLRFAAASEPCRWFWSNGSAWGTVEQRPGAAGIEVRLTVLYGMLRIQRLELDGHGSWTSQSHNC